jgi:hypothetical protein
MKAVILAGGSNKYITLIKIVKIVVGFDGEIKHI